LHKKNKSHLAQNDETLKRVMNPQPVWKTENNKRGKKKKTQKWRRRRKGHVLTFFTCQNQLVKVAANLWDIVIVNLNGLEYTHLPGKPAFSAITQT